MIYEKVIPVEFNHCDPAGIVFYPRYFEMCNSVVENFFTDIVQAPFSVIHAQAGSGIPAASIQVDFHAPSRLGDKLNFVLSVEKLGRSSLSLLITATCADEKRISIHITVVWIVNGRPQSWPPEIQMKLAAFC